MRGKLRLFHFIVMFCILVVSVILFSSLYKYKCMDRDNSFECIRYWKDILGKRESDVNYITKWFENNQSVQFIYNTQGGNVCFKKEDECLMNLDSCITKFVEENDIYIEKYEDGEQLEAGSIISFSHEFFEKKRLAGRYCLMYIKDEKAVRKSFYKIKDDYYCEVIFYGE